MGVVLESNAHLTLNSVTTANFIIWDESLVGVENKYELSKFIHVGSQKISNLVQRVSSDSSSLTYTEDVITCLDLL